MPDRGLFRAGRWSDVDTFPRPAPRLSLHGPQTDGYRWEDAAGHFATAKCSASDEAAVGRTIARYRPREVPGFPVTPEAPGGGGIIGAILDDLTDDPDPGDPELAHGAIPSSVFDDLYSITVPADRGVLFVDVDHEATLATLHAQLGPTLKALGMPPITGDLARAEDRRITRLAMSVLHALVADGGRGPVAGIRYAGHPDLEWEAFVLWSPPELVCLTNENVALRWLAPWDEAVQAAATRLGITFSDDSLNESSG